MTYEKAKSHAISVGEKLRPYCEILHISGSLRRRQSEIKEIKIICVPRFTVQTISDLFGETKSTNIISENFISALTSLGKIVKGSYHDDHVKVNYHGSLVNIFMPEPADFFRQYVIHTGSSDYIQRKIIPAWSQMGWCDTKKGLRRINDCTKITLPNKYALYEISNHDGQRPPAWKSEAEFFAWIGVPLVHARYRIIPVM